MAAKSYLRRIAGRPVVTSAIIVSAGAANDGDHVALNASGKFDISVMPTGIGQNTISAVASEALAAGNFVNLYDVAGVLTVRKADATTVGKEAKGFVKVAVASAATATVYLNGNVNDALSGLTNGASYSLATTAGGIVLSSAEPSATGNVAQVLGIALSTTSLMVDIEEAPTTM